MEEDTNFQQQDLINAPTENKDAIKNPTFITKDKQLETNPVAATHTTDKTLYFIPTPFNQHFKTLKQKIYITKE